MNNDKRHIGIGITGTRKGMNEYQTKFLTVFLSGLSELFKLTFHHGCCEGVDLESAEIFRNIIGEYCNIIQHPPTNMFVAKLNENDGKVKAKPFLERNHDIVDACDFLIGIPGECEEVLRSGTWATIRYARKINKKNKIIYPDKEFNKSKSN